MSPEPNDTPKTEATLTPPAAELSEADLEKVAGGGLIDDVIGFAVPKTVTEGGSRHTNVIL